MAVLLGLAAGADRISVLVAEHTVAAKIRSSERLESTPTVHIAGFPFLAQLIGQTLDEVDLTVRNFAAGSPGHVVQIARLAVQLRRVHLMRSYSAARAETATATALISYPALSGVLGVDLRYGGASTDGLGRVEAVTSTSILGQPVSGTASAEVRVSTANVLSFVNPRAVIEGASVPQVVVGALTAVFGNSIALGRLPFGLVLESVRATSAGVSVVLTGTNLTYG